MSVGLVIDKSWSHKEHLIETWLISVQMVFATGWAMFVLVSHKIVCRCIMEFKPLGLDLPKLKLWTPLPKLKLWIPIDKSITHKKNGR
ncbi:MAG: hypothetical protein DRR08_19450 [Candidatus Parabeggiatoa sp. nov. 2]|nr:MAG: hypothetical protein B6247_03230 [Beggiatoa sp. 4572_84]RKZ57294.1 MAG: hypothetical protein DRR08_19450 [Gammaproteobacteria bacterium]